MPTHNYSTNTETLLLLAWCCNTLDLQALAEKDRQNRPHRYPKPREEWLPVFPEHMLSEQDYGSAQMFSRRPLRSSPPESRQISSCVGRY